MRSVVIFIAKWALAGLVFALALVWMRPDLRSASPSPAAVQVPQQSLPVIAAPTPAHAAPTALDSFADAVAKARDAVVNIYTKRIVAQRVRPPELDRYFGDRWPAVQQRVQGSLGSGVIIDGQGHVVTNYHLIEKAEQINLQLADGRIADATVVGIDPDTDLAVLRIKIEKLPVMTLGRSEKLRVGDVVLAIGNPYGLQQTVTHGIVSATGRDMGFANFESFIQTDAAINLGSSGGALVNAQGELVGINTAVLAQNTEGIGFAIPVDLMRGVVEQIIKYGHVRRGWLGVTPQPVSSQRAAELGIANNLGVELMGIDPDSPAERAGLKVGDVILTINGVAVHDSREATSRVASHAPGQQVHLQARRGHETLELKVKVGERPESN
jgi:Do/DeqQ family serine protease